MTNKNHVNESKTKLFFNRIETYDHTWTTAVSRRVGGTDHFESRFAYRGRVEGNSAEISNDQDLEDPRENWEDEGAHEVSDGSRKQNKEMLSWVWWMTTNKESNWLASVTDETDSDANTITQKDEHQDECNHRYAQNDEKGHPRFAQCQIRFQFGCKSNLGQCLIGSREIFQLRVAAKTVPTSYFKSNTQKFIRVWIKAKCSTIITNSLKS